MVIKSILIITSLLGFSIITAAAPKKDLKAEKVAKIKSDPAFYCGEGTGATMAEANRNSLIDLSGNIKTVVASSLSEKENNFGLTISSKTGISSFTTLSNTEVIELSPEPNAHVFRYVAKSEIAKLIEEREERIKNLINQARNLESKAEIASALKYYNWALALSKVHPNNIQVKVTNDGKISTAKEWLLAKIPTVLNNIKVSISDIEDRGESEISRYAVTLAFTYNNEPIADLEFGYDDGMKMARNNHVKNGQATIDFCELPEKAIDLAYSYTYEEAGARYDNELRGYYEAYEAETFPQGSTSIPVKGSTIKKFKEAAPQRTAALPTLTHAMTQSVAPETAEHARTIERPSADNSTHDLVAKRMEIIENALRKNDLEPVRQYFTDSGWEQAMMMLGSAKKIEVRKRKTPEYEVEQTSLFLVGKSIPVCLKYKDGHNATENLILRFSSDGRCESLAFALTERAQEDIFRQNRWDLNARYAILKFMEDYQTAFAIKNLPYIEKIFSDDAIIITGKKDTNSKKSGKKDGIFITNLGDGYTYTQKTKEEYIENLRNDFNNKIYINLTFEENEIANQGGNYNDIYWIEIKQFYNSSAYSDEGFLTLQLDMRNASPVIKVRTWQPFFIQLDEMMRRFSINDEN